MDNSRIIQSENMLVPVKIWDKGVLMEQDTIAQISKIAQLPFVYRHAALMPDGHVGIGATVGSVVATKLAIVPAITGVDIGCGMVAVKTSLKAEELPDSLLDLRIAIENAVPHGGPGTRGTWGEIGRYGPPASVSKLFLGQLDTGYKHLSDKHPKIKGKMDTNLNQLGTLGGGNHFIEVCLDESGFVWIMLHSGSRGVGNRIGSYFIELAKKDMGRLIHNLPDKDLAYLDEGTEHFNDYWDAVQWAQHYAKANRQVMLDNVLRALKNSVTVPFSVTSEAVNCHHNYVAKETHYGEEVYVTRKGAVSAQKDEFGIIPGSMGARSFIVKGLGNPESFMSCSHGAGRAMSRGEAKRRFTVEDHANATEFVECRKDASVIDETPMAYKDIDSVINAQSDLVEIVTTLRQVVCVKG